MNRKMISLMALFIALSAVGAAIKIPAIIGSVALDVFPALLAGVFFSSAAGSVVAALGHLLSAMLSGFPLGPMHLVISLEMAVLIALFSSVYKKGKKTAAAFVFILGNTILAPLPFIFLINKAFYFSIIPSLLIGSIINTGIAVFIIPRLMSFNKLVITKRNENL